MAISPFLPRKLPGHLLAAAFLATVPVDSEAEEDAASRRGKTMQLAPVQVTATRVAQPSFNLPQAVTVITADDIRSKAPQVMAELLRGEPGVYFQQTGPGQGMAIVRGLKGAEVLHLVDGFRLNNAFFRTAPSQYIALIDAYNIDQLEVLRGPYATLYGSDAMGGVVQIRTPEQRFGSDTPATRTRVVGHYASADLAKVGRISHAIGSKTLSVAGGITTASYGNRLAGGIGQVADGRGNIGLAKRVGPNAYTARSYDLKTIWAPTQADELTLSLQYYDLPSGLPRYNELVPGSKPLTASNPGAAQSLYFNSREFYQLRWRHQAPVAFIDTLELHLGRQVIDDDRYDLQRNLTTQDLEKNRSTLDGLTVNATTVLKAHRLSYGLELYQDRIKSNRYRKTGNGPYRANSTGTSFKSRFPNGARADNFGAYLSDSWQLAPDWLLDLGARGNYTASYLPAAPASDRANGGVIRNTDTSAQAGLRYAISRGLAWTSNLGRGYRAPNINDLAAVGNRSGGRIVVANTALKPESLLSLDTGLKFRRGGLSGEAVVFYSEYQDRITLIANPSPVVNGQQGCTEAAGCAQSQNIAKASYYGLESGLRYRVSPTLTARATLNYTRAEQDSNGVTEPGNRVPPLNGLVSLNWQPLPTLELEPSLWFNDTQDRLDATDQADNRIASGGTAGFAVANLRASWTPNDTYRVQLLGENLLDKSYREHGSGIDGRGRGVALTLEANFR